MSTKATKKKIVKAEPDVHIGFADSKSTAEGGPGPVTRKARKPRGPKAYAYATVLDGEVGNLSGPYATEAEMLEDITLGSAENAEVVTFREVRRGKLRVTKKVKIG